MKVLLISIALIGFIAMKSSAQNETDFLRYSQPSLNGSARYIGMGGAFTALGGDASAIGRNAAGTAIFNNSELVFGLGLNTTSQSAQYIGKNSEAFGGKVTIPTLSYVWHRGPKTESDKWKAFNFAYSYNRLKDFNQNSVVSGVNQNNSISDDFASKIQGVSSADNGDNIYNAAAFDSYLAFQAGLIEEDSTNPGNYFSTIYGAVNQKVRTETSGRMGENLFSFGGNYNNKLYLGAAVAINSINYSQVQSFSESTDSVDSYIKSFNYRFNLNASGYAYNFRIGAIYRVTDGLRVGVSYQTPTINKLNENYNSTLGVIYFTDQENNYSSDNGSFSYRIISPSKIGFGVAYVIGKIGIISADYDRFDYSNAQFKNSISWSKDLPQEDFTPENDAISTRLQATNNIRVGTEWRIKQWSVRLGYGINQNAYKGEYSKNFSDMTTKSFGVGYRIKNASIDFGIANSQYTTNYSPFLIAPELKENAIISHSATSASLTMAIKF